MRKLLCWLGFHDYKRVTSLSDTWRNPYIKREICTCCGKFKQIYTSPLTGEQFEI